MTEITKLDIQKLIINFYSRINKDELLSPIFNDIAKVDWDVHIPLLCKFWNNIMLKTNDYFGNALMKHVELGNLVEVEEKHFVRWLSLFQQEVNKHLPVDKAEEVFNKALQIAKSLRYRMSGKDLQISKFLE